MEKPKISAKTLRDNLIYPLGLKPTQNVGQPDPFQFYHPDYSLLDLCLCLGIAVLWEIMARVRRNLLPDISLPKHDAGVRREPERAVFRKLRFAKQNLFMIEHALPDDPFGDGVFAFAEVRQDKQLLALMKPGET